MIKILIALVVVLAVVVIARLIRIWELSSEINGVDESEVTQNDINFNGYLMFFFLLIGFAFVIYETIAYSGLMLPQAAS